MCPKPLLVGVLTIGLSCGGGAGATGGTTTAGASSSSGGGSGGSSGSSGSPLSGVCTVTRITCAGSTASIVAATYTAPNSFVFELSAPTGQATTANGCTYTVPATLTYTGSEAFSVTPTGATSCNPARCIAACGSHGGTTVHYRYSQTGNTLTLTSSDNTICGAANGPTQPTVITCTLQ